MNRGEFGTLNQHSLVFFPDPINLMFLRKASNWFTSAQTHLYNHIQKRTIWNLQVTDMFVIRNASGFIFTVTFLSSVLIQASSEKRKGIMSHRKSIKQDFQFIRRYRNKMQKLLNRKS